MYMHKKIYVYACLKVLHKFIHIKYPYKKIIKSGRMLYLMLMQILGWNAIWKQRRSNVWLKAKKKLPLLRKHAWNDTLDITVYMYIIKKYYAD